MRVWHAIIILGVSASMLLAVCAEVTRDAAETQGVWDAVEAHAPAASFGPSSGVYSAHDGVIYWAEEGTAVLKLERRIVGGVPMLSLQRPEVKRRTLAIADKDIEKPEPRCSWCGTLFKTRPGKITHSGVDSGFRLCDECGGKMYYNETEVKP